MQNPSRTVSHELGSFFGPKGPFFEASLSSSYAEKMLRFSASGFAGQIRPPKLSISIGETFNQNAIAS